MKRFFILVYMPILFVMNASSAAQIKSEQETAWTESQMKQLNYLWIKNLAPLGSDPSNSVANEKTAIDFGKKIFFDPSFSINGKISCSSCHKPELYFTDGLPRSIGRVKTRSNAPTLLGAAYSPWFFWDGRADSQWAQALGPLEHVAEHAGNRTQYAKIIWNKREYKKAYEKLFGPMPRLSDKKRFPDNAGPKGDEQVRHQWSQMSAQDQVQITTIFANLGKVLAAYQRTLKPEAARFDAYVEALIAQDSKKANKLFNAEEVAGLKLFIGKAMCVICHNGPLLSTYEFKNIGLPVVKELGVEQGRFRALREVTLSEFNCLGKYSSAKESDCAELRFMKTMRDETMGAFKIPTLRNVAKTAPYMHAGQFETLSEVLKHYQKRPITRVGHTDLLVTDLSDNDLKKLEAFLMTLTSQN
ncbi:MAG: cytochrome-c peroxidase [Gammaproteobacteria bacterium]|nr:cytochrome-c peroxidase [Gammaproteobacteria bacterium]MDH5728091.1 cytochrome-c peroxidase [Gammaproteobacteria bacterium]